jgi:hypothetical protein
LELKIHEKLKFKENEDIANCYFIISKLNLDLGNFEEALQYAEKEYKIKEKLCNKCDN